MIPQHKYMDGLDFLLTVQQIRIWDRSPINHLSAYLLFISIHRENQVPKHIFRFNLSNLDFKVKLSGMVTKHILLS